MQIPAPPGAGSEEGFEFVNSADIPASDASSGDRESVYKQLQEELVKQIKVNICVIGLFHVERRYDHYTLNIYIYTLWRLRTLKSNVTKKYFLT